MTNKNRTQDQQGSPQPPQVGADPPCDVALPPLSADSCASGTAEAQVPTTADQVAPEVECDQTLGETSDSMPGDATRADIRSRGLLARLRRLRPCWGSACKSATVPPVAPTGEAEHRGLRPWQWGLIALGATLLVIAVLVGVDAGLYYNKIHYGVKVAGQDLGGVTSDRATETLSAFAEQTQKRAITLESESGSQTWKVLPSDLVASVDVPAAVSKATGITRNSNVFVDLAKKIGLYFSGDDLPLEQAIDTGKMDTLIASIAEALDLPATEASLVVKKGSVEVLEGKQGNVVDKDALRASLTHLLLTFQSTDLTIPMVTVSPALSAEDVAPVLPQANVMIGSDIVVTLKGKTLATVTPEEIFTYLDIVSGGGVATAKTEPILSAEKMTTLFDTLDKKVGMPGVDAHFEVDVKADTFKMIGGVDGVGLDRQATAAALTQAALSTSGRKAEVVLKAIPPALTTAEVEAMGIKDILGEYATTPYRGPGGRQINVRLATKQCSGVFLAPGEEFDTDKHLGPRTKANGWHVAPGISASGLVEDVYGGGICQVSTTLFNAVLLAGLEITERHNHSLYIYHYPDGRDATVSGGGKNLRFRNDTDHYVYVYGTSTGVTTRFYILGVADGRKVLPIVFSGFKIGPPFTSETRINRSLPPGTTIELCAGTRSRSCSIQRTVVYAGGTTKSQTWSSEYSAINHIVETNPL